MTYTKGYVVCSISLVLTYSHKLTHTRTNLLPQYRIENYCNNYASQHKQPSFQLFDNLDPLVTTQQCFDDLRVDPSHISRRPSDTYYIDPNTVC
ncbi:hypothetical protein EON63_16815 [archaeon]|nr:MAG: hypothetical protein EON63_16815 [archaeon]